MNVYDGDGLNATKIGRLTGIFPDNVVSTGPDIYLSFVSDENLSKSWFKIQYDAGKNWFYELGTHTLTISFITIFMTIFITFYLLVHPSAGNPCGIHKPFAITNSTTGLITSPNYPLPYPNNADCQWHIQVKRGYIVQLTVLYFFLDNG